MSDDQYEKIIHETNASQFENWTNEETMHREKFSADLARICKLISNDDYKPDVIAVIDSIEHQFDFALDQVRFLRATIYGRPLDYDLDAWLAFAQEKANMAQAIRHVIETHRTQGEILDLMAMQMFDIDPCTAQLPEVDWDVVRSQVFKQFSKDEGNTVERVLDCCKVALGYGDPAAQGGAA